MKGGFKNYIFGVFSGIFCCYLLFTLSSLHNFHKPNINQNGNNYKENIKEKEIITNNDNKFNNLYPDWNRNILNDNINNKKNLESDENIFIKNDHISFIKFKFDTLSEGSIELAPSTNFWYSFEDTYHSAAYIVSNEKKAVEFWRKNLHISMKKNLKNNLNSYCLDIGSNGGFYSLLSRSVGCVTMAVDTQPWCLTRLSSSAAINGFNTDFSVHWGAISNQKDLVFDVGSTKCSGLWAVQDSAWINEESQHNSIVASNRMDLLINNWIGEDKTISILKIDAEGSEMSILLSGLSLFINDKIDTVLVEISPSRAEKITPLEDIINLINVIYKSGFTFTMLEHSIGTIVDAKQMIDFMSPGEINTKLGPKRGAPTLFTITKKNIYK